jgi:hypothetical protein
MAADWARGLVAADGAPAVALVGVPLVQLNAGAVEAAAEEVGDGLMHGLLHSLFVAADAGSSNGDALMAGGSFRSLKQAVVGLSVRPPPPPDKLSGVEILARLVVRVVPMT